MSIAAIIIVVILLYISIFIHEIGHFVIGKIVKIPVKTVSIGSGPNIFRFNFLNVEFKFSMLPGGKISTCLAKEVFFKIDLSKRLLLLSGGILFNILTILACILLIIICNIKPSPLEYLTHSLRMIQISGILSFFYNLFKLMEGGKENLFVVLIMLNLLILVLSLVPCLKFDLGNMIFSIIEKKFPGSVKSYLIYSEGLRVVFYIAIFISTIIDIRNMFLFK